MAENGFYNDPSTLIEYSAMAAYNRGQIAEHNFDYKLAYKKYRRAHELQPDNIHYEQAFNHMAKIIHNP